MEGEFKPIARSSSVAPIIKLAASLRFFAEGNFQRGVGQDFFVGMAQSTISVVLAEVLNIMEKKICPKWLKFQVSDREKEECKREFFNKTSFPGVKRCLSVHSTTQM